MVMHFPIPLICLWKQLFVLIRCSASQTNYVTCFPLQSFLKIQMLVIWGFFLYLFFPVNNFKIKGLSNQLANSVPKIDP